MTPGTGENRATPTSREHGRHPHQSDKRAGLRPALVAGLVVAMTAGALFGAVQLSQAVARTSAELHLADEAARAATVVRSHIALAALGSGEQQAVSWAEAGAALGALNGSLAALELSPDAIPAVGAARSFVEEANRLVDLIGKSEIVQDGADARFDEMMTELDALRTSLVERIEVLDSSYNALGIALGIATVGLAPLVLVIWTRSIARRSMEVRELSLRLQHEAEMRDAHSSVLRTVVHEFRTPLTGIGGLAAMLEDPSIRSSDEGGEMVTMIRNEAEDMSQLTDDILTAAGMESGNLEIRLEPVDVAQAAKRTVTTFDRRGLEIELSLEPGKAIADELRLRQVLKNLISNAVKYGGPQVRVIGSVRQDCYEIEVTDDGPGIPEAIVDRVFEPFPYGGIGAPTQSVGLGLFIVKQLIEAMSGSVSYAREDDRTVFTVRLPLDSEPEAAEVLVPTVSIGG